MFNPRRPKYRGNRALYLLDFLRSTRAARWIGFERYKDTGIKLNGLEIDKDQWIFVREALLHLNSTGFIHLRKYTNVINQC